MTFFYSGETPKQKFRLPKKKNRNRPHIFVTSGYPIKNVSTFNTGGSSSRQRFALHGSDQFGRPILAIREDRSFPLRGAIYHLIRLLPSPVLRFGGRLSIVIRRGAIRLCTTTTITTFRPARC